MVLLVSKVRSIDFKQLQVLLENLQELPKVACRSLRLQLLELNQSLLVPIKLKLLFLVRKYCKFFCYHQRTYYQDRGSFCL